MLRRTSAKTIRRIAYKKYSFIRGICEAVLFQKMTLDKRVLSKNYLVIHNKPKLTVKKRQ